MWELHRAARAPRRRRRRCFDSFSSSTPKSERGSGAFQTSTLTHAHTRASFYQSKPCNPRARTPEERGQRQKRRKKGEGASHWRRQRQQLREPRQQAAREMPTAAAAVQAPTRTSRSICIPAPGNWSKRGWAGRRSGDVRKAGRRTGSAGAVQLARGENSRGPSRGQNEPPAGGRASKRA
ncbi:Hypothetical predicted protein, partial [Marmota monax]